MLFDKKLVVLIALAIFYSQGWAQIESGGIPRSFNYRAALKPDAVIRVKSPDMNAIGMEDKGDAGLEKPYRVGVEVPANLSIAESGVWDDLQGGDRLWRLHISCPGAVALGIDYFSFYLPPGADLFIYNSGHTQVAGAYTASNNIRGHSFSTRPLLGDEIILEYFQPADCIDVPVIEISGLNFIYRGMNVGLPRNGDNFGGAGSCEVNVNCSEGDNWKSQANGVVRILTRVKGQSYWCTGSLLNNTRLDFTPLILTANHCTQGAGYVSSPADLEKWIFYFNYESDSCEDPVSEPPIHSMTGASKLASSENPAAMGSDFYLVRLNQEIPMAYEPYFNGWSISNIPSGSGVGLHHPEGDIKKVSTYKTPVSSGSWDPPGDTHWMVKWSESTNGYGVTEVGSSGSPIFDSDGLVIGTLTGGDSGCANSTGIDYYGKVAYSWQSNGSADSMQLKPWLDPLNLGFNTLRGTNNDNFAVADFEADDPDTTIIVGGTLNFSDLSTGNINGWHWYFEGGEPSESHDRSPRGIQYFSFGKFSVKLRVTNLYGSDSLIKSSYVKVKALVYPNPTSGSISIYMDSQVKEDVKVEIYNQLGIQIYYQHLVDFKDKLIPINLPWGGNLFYLKLIRGSQVQTEKIVVIR
jgi:hypothetical protein